VAARATAERENLGERSARILDEVVARGHITTAEAAQLLGVTTDTASTYLGRLQKAGKIDKNGRGSWAPTYLVPTVGSVGSVGIPNNPNGTNRGYKRDDSAALWQYAYEMGDPEPPEEGWKRAAEGR
jgi:hypothetical protein